MTRIPSTTLSRRLALAGLAALGLAASPLGAPDASAQTAKTLRIGVSPGPHAQILEVDPQSISLSDRLIDSALTGSTPDGKPSVQSMSDFTKALKADPRWKKTDNARDEIASTMYSIGRMMGFA